MKQKFLLWLTKYKYILSIFIITTIFFIIQHLFVLSWDFIAYSLNAKHIFNAGIYFETFRPPLTAIIIGLFAQIMGYTLAEISYIVLVNILFCVSVVLISEKINFNIEIFYLLLLTPFVLFYGLINGTELLSITLLLFGIYFILKNNWISGLFIGLSALTRYTGIIFGVFLLFHNGIKNKLKSIFLFCLIFLPWFIYNRIEFGNFFTSLADQYFQNVISRVGVEQTPQLIHFIYVQSILFIFTIIGLLYFIYLLIKSINKIDSRINLKISIIMLFILIYTIYSYFSTPFKDVRYLFPIMLPIAYFTYFGVISSLLWINNKNNLIKHQQLFFKKLRWILIIILIISCLLVLQFNFKSCNSLRGRYVSAIDLINDINQQDCLMYADNWIYFNYLDENIVMLPVEVYFNDLSFYKNKILFLYLNHYKLDDQKTLENNFPVIYKDDFFLIIGDFSDCKKKSEYDKLFYDIFKYGVVNNLENKIYTDPCNILFNKVKYMDQFCKYLNYNLFVDKSN